MPGLSSVIASFNIQYFKRTHKVYISKLDNMDASYDLFQFSINISEVGCTDILVILHTQNKLQHHLLTLSLGIYYASG